MFKFCFKHNFMKFFERQQFFSSIKTKQLINLVYNKETKINLIILLDKKKITLFVFQQLNSYRILVNFCGFDTLFFFHFLII
jgi:hypothetical protein